MYKHSPYTMYKHSPCTMYKHSPCTMYKHRPYTMYKHSPCTMYTWKERKAYDAWKNIGIGKQLNEWSLNNGEICGP